MGYVFVQIQYPHGSLILHPQQSFSSTNQSPCDVAAELAGICTGSRECLFGYRFIKLAPIITLGFALAPLDPGAQYRGPAADVRKQLQLQLCLLLAAECLCALPEARLHSVTLDDSQLVLLI
jgi:hypothetical protein